MEAGLDSQMLSKNNALNVVYSYSDSDDYTSSGTYSYTYTYDGKYPTMVMDKDGDMTFYEYE